MNACPAINFLDMSHGFEWQGVFSDAGYRRVETASRTGEAAREQTFMRLSALHGSILENRLFEDDFQVESVSIAKLLQLAAANGAHLPQAAIVFEVALRGQVALRGKVSKNQKHSEDCYAVELS